MKLKMKKLSIMFLAILAMLTFSQSAFANPSIFWTMNTDQNGFCVSAFRDYDVTPTSAQVLQYASSSILDCHVEAFGYVYVTNVSEVSFDWSYMVTSPNHYAQIKVYVESMTAEFEVYCDWERDDSGSHTLYLPSGYSGVVYFVADAGASSFSYTGISFASISNITFN